MVRHRQLVARVAMILRDSIAAGSGSAVTRLHLYGIVSDFWRGAVVTAIGLALALVFAPRILGSWYLAHEPSAAWPVALAMATAAASIVRSAQGVPRASLFLAGGSAIGLGLVFAR